MPARPVTHNPRVLLDDETLRTRLAEPSGEWRTREELRDAAKRVLGKVEAVLPPKDRHRVRDTALFSLRGYYATKASKFMAELRRAIDELRKVTLVYTDRQDAETTRTIRPLALYHWGHVWTVAAWCELRDDFRIFRLDRISKADVSTRRFRLEAPVTLEEFERRMSER